MLDYLGRARGRGILLEKLMLAALIGIDATLLPMTILEKKPGGHIIKRFLLDGGLRNVTTKKESRRALEFYLTIIRMLLTLLIKLFTINSFDSKSRPQFWNCRVP